MPDPLGFVESFPQYLDFLAGSLDANSRNTVILAVEDGLKCLRKAGLSELAGSMEAECYNTLLEELMRENPIYTNPQYTIN